MWVAYVNELMHVIMQLSERVSELFVYDKCRVLLDLMLRLHLQDGCVSMS